MARFTPEFLDELKSRLRPSDVIGRFVKLKKKGNEWAGLSPFTNEKTASFYVNDQKGFFKDFSSGKFGDVITFLMETQKLAFHEAVERLAEEAGMEIPKDTPADARRAEERKGLVEACEEAARFFTAALRRIDGRDARDYLERRAVATDLIETFGIGFAPAGRSALKDHLVNKGFQVDQLVEAGLLIKPEGGGAPYDRFRGRIIFPILGARDRPIAFGGRAMGDVQPKYLNSPETPLFHKGDVLYNFSRARRASAKADNAALVVCEGYMDVIALAGAGFGYAVAPLGTALTERQLALLWQASDEPMLCFDGDRAGLAAAYRAIDRALPLLKPGKSVRFVFLPEGQDPDDLVRAAGPQAFAEALAAARPLVDVLWERERDARPLDTPERRAAFRTHLRALVRSIADKDVRKAYGETLAGRLDDAFAPPARQRAQPAGARGGDHGAGRGAYGRGGAGGYGARGAPPAHPSALLTRTRPASGADGARRREAALVLAVVHTPAIIARQEEAFVALLLSDPDLRRLQGAILDAVAEDPALDTEKLKRHLTASGHARILERLLSDKRLILEKFARPGADMDEAERGWLSAHALHLHHGALREEAAQAARDMSREPEARSEAWWRTAVTNRQAILANDDDGRSTPDD